MRRLLILISCSAALAACLLTSARAQSIRWEPPAGTLAFGQASELQLVFDGCAPKGDPVVPAVAGLFLQQVGRTNQTSIENGRVTRSETLTFVARPAQRTPVAIPEFSVETDKGRLTVPAARYDVGDATVGQSNVPLDNVANSRITLPAAVWAGEVFKLNYTLNVGRRYFHSAGSNFPEWNPAPLVVEDWAKPDVAESLVNGDNRVVISYNTRGLLRLPGPVTVNPASQLVNITTGSSGLGFFPRPNLEQYAITSTRPSVEVRPLPGNAPASFGGAVGQFTLKSNVVPVTATVGEPITWTLSLAGTGNWPDITGLPSREVSKDFRTVQPQAKRTPKEGLLFDATSVEDVVLIPTKAGTYTLGPVTWSYFDPAKGEYRIVTTDRTTVTVTPPAALPTSPTTAAPERRQEAITTGKAAAPATPRAIPRDPLPDDSGAATPLGPLALLVATLVPFGILLLFWLTLALRRARATDPLRARREARSRISTTLAALRTTHDRDRVATLLLSWQKDAAVLWQLPQAVPAPASFPSNNPAWPALWSEADRTLYRPGTPLPADWIARAETALEAQPVRPFSLLQLFRLKNLFPFAALAALGLLLPATPSHAADGRTAYEKGDFAAAETAWRDTIALRPASASAHHNLSLALAQQDRWTEAAAHAAAAFAQQPRNPAVYWNFGFTLERAGFAPSVFAGFARSDPPHALARQLSPVHWQYVLVLAATLAAAALALLLLRSYGRPSRWLKAGAVTLLCLGVALAALSTVSLRVYSPVNDARAVIVWRASTLRSIPTEADTEQKTSALAAGTVAIIDRSFLNDRWSRLSFPNGQTGWVRKDDLVGLWR